MVAYNFQPRFAALVESGAKTQTIRAPRKSRHARVGEPVQLYTGMRTAQCRKLIDPDPVCVLAEPVTLDAAQVRIGDLQISGSRLYWLREELDAFARADGFEEWVDLFGWFDTTHGLPFTGMLIRWAHPKAHRPSAPLRGSAAAPREGQE